MLPKLEHIREIIRWHIADRQRQGYDVSGCEDGLAAMPDSYDALFAYARALNELPRRPAWPYVEPVTWDEVTRNAIRTGQVIPSQPSTCPQAPPA